LKFLSFNWVLKRVIKTYLKLKDYRFTAQMVSIDSMRNRVFEKISNKLKLDQFINRFKE